MLKQNTYINYYQEKNFLESQYSKRSTIELNASDKLIECNNKRKNSLTNTIFFSSLSSGTESVVSKSKKKKMAISYQGSEVSVCITPHASSVLVY